MLHSLPDAVFVVNPDGLEQPSQMIDIKATQGMFRPVKASMKGSSSAELMTARPSTRRSVICRTAALKERESRVKGLKRIP